MRGVAAGALETALTALGSAEALTVARDPDLGARGRLEKGHNGGLERGASGEILAKGVSVAREANGALEVTLVADCGLLSRGEARRDDDPRVSGRAGRCRASSASRQVPARVSVAPTAADRGGRG